MDLYFIFAVVQVANTFYLDKIISNYRFIPGTKTFDDRESKTSRIRYKAFMDMYKQKFSALDRCKLFLYRKIYLIFHPGIAIDKYLGLFGVLLKKRNQKFYYKIRGFKILFSNFLKRP